MAILNDREDLFKLSRISEDEFREKLKEHAGLKFDNKQRMLQYDNIRHALLSILETRKGSHIDEIRANLDDPGTARRLNEWLEDLKVNGIDHPELWSVCSRFLMRALRGELVNARQQYPSHEESKKKLMASLC